ncbi:MAG: Gfo/Idh/MocA family protein [Spirochaetia bacterium]
MRQMGVGIIGYGFMGKVHAFGYRSIPFYYDPPPVEVRLVGVATSSAQTAEAARTHGGFEVATSDWRGLIERRDIAIIDVCSPNTLHAEQLKAAMAAGKHIYCDKPLTVTLQEAEAVGDAMEGWTGIGQMALHNRFFSGVLRARQLIEEGFLGSPIGFRAVYLHAGSVDPSAPLKWKLRASEGGGVLRDLGSHLLDLVDWLAGPITEVRADTRILHATRPDGRGGVREVDAEDQVIISARLAGGALGTLEASKIATGAEDDLRVEINGTRGAIRFDVMQPDFVEIFSLADAGMPLGGTRGWKRVPALQRYPAPAGFPSARATSGWLRGHIHCQYSFLRAVAEGGTADPSISRGIDVQRLMESVEKSVKTGAWQAVPRGA